MKKVLLIFAILGLFSCEEDNVKPLEEVEEVVLSVSVEARQTSSTYFYITPETIKITGGKKGSETVLDNNDWDSYNVDIELFESIVSDSPTSCRDCLFWTVEVETDKETYEAKFRDDSNVLEFVIRLKKYL